MHTLDREIPPPLFPDFPGQVAASLPEAEAGNWRAWWQLNCYLKLTPKGRGWIDDLDHFIADMPGWASADESVRNRIIATAERYLVEAETTADVWFGCGPMPLQRNHLAGFQAFILLHQVSPARYRRISKASWRKWTLTIVGLPRRIVVQNSLDIASILQDALAHAPAEFVAAVRTMIKRERERLRSPGAAPKPGIPFLILRDLEGCCGGTLLKDAVFDELRAADNSPASNAALLDALLEAGFKPAFDHALAELSGPAPQQRNGYVVSPTFCYAVRRRALGRLYGGRSRRTMTWRGISCFMSLRISASARRSMPASASVRSQTWTPCWRLFPPGDDVERSGKFISQFDSIGYLRDGAPRYLAGMGTAAAVKALSGLITDHPAFSSLTYDLSLAERAMRIATWSPLTPKEVLALADWPDLQLVMSSVDLLGTLVTALEKYAAALHGAQTPIMDLWDEQHREHTFRHRFPPYFL